MTPRASGKDSPLLPLGARLFSCGGFGSSSRGAGLASPQHRIEQRPCGLNDPALNLGSDYQRARWRVRERATLAAMLKSCRTASSTIIAAAATCLYSGSGLDTQL